MPSLKFSKKEKLKSRKIIQQLFEERQSISVFPLRLIWGVISPPLSEYPAQFAVSVPKRTFQKAVQRNRIKRLIKEAYRLKKADLYATLTKEESQYGLMFLYTGKKEPCYSEIEKALKKIFPLFLKRLKKKRPA